MVLICFKMNPLHPRMFKMLLSLIVIGPVVLEKKVFKISLFRYYLPLEKGVALQFDEIKLPSPEDALCQVWSKLAPCFKRRFLNFINVFSLFRYLPLKKVQSLIFKIILNPRHPKVLYVCQVWAKLAFCF